MLLRIGLLQLVGVATQLLGRRTTWGPVEPVGCLAGLAAPRLGNQQLGGVLIFEDPDSHGPMTTWRAIRAWWGNMASGGNKCQLSEPISLGTKSQLLRCLPAAAGEPTSQHQQSSTQVLGTLEYSRSINDLVCQEEIFTMKCSGKSSSQHLEQQNDQP